MLQSVNRLDATPGEARRRDESIAFGDIDVHI